MPLNFFSKRKILIPLLASIVALFSCKEEPKPQKYFKYFIEGETQGTTYHITYIDTVDREVRVQQQVDSILEVIDNSLSTYNPNSIVSKLNRSDSCTLIDEHILTMFLMSDEINSVSDGAFDPTVKPLVNLWGFGDSPMNFDTLFRSPEDSLIRDSLVARYKDSLAYDYLDYVGMEYLLLDGDIKYNNFDDMTSGEFNDNFICKDDSLVQIGFNAIAQGYSADVIGDFFNFNLAIGDFLIEIGGEVLAQGIKLDNKPWRVQIEHPDIMNPDAPPGIAIMEMDSFRAVAVSGNYRSYVKNSKEYYGHSIDPRTGHPAKNKIISVAVFADDAATADAYATAFMVMGIEEIVPLVELDAMGEIQAFFVYENEDGEVETFTSTELEDLLILPNQPTNPPTKK